MFPYKFLRALCFLYVFVSVLSEHSKRAERRSKRTVGLLLSGLSNFLNVHDDIQVTTPISITTSAPTVNKRPPPPKVQKWPPLDFEITPYVLSLISAKKQPSKPTPTEVPTYLPPTEEPYYHAQVFFLPLRDLENQLNNQHDVKSIYNNPSSLSQHMQQTPPNIPYHNFNIRDRLLDERYAQNYASIQLAANPHLNYQANNKIQFNPKGLNNSTTKKKASLQQKDLDYLLEKLSSIFANPNDGELSGIAGNDVTNDKTQYRSFIDQEPKVSYPRQQIPEKSRDSSNLLLLERLRRVQNNVNSVRIPTGHNNKQNRPTPNSHVETNVEIIKSLEPNLGSNSDSQNLLAKDDIEQHSARENIDFIMHNERQDGINNNHKDGKHNDRSTVEISRSLEFPIKSSSLTSNSSDVDDRHLIYDGSIIKVHGELYPIHTSQYTNKILQTPQSGKNSKGQNLNNSKIQILFSPSIEVVKNYESEDDVHVPKRFPVPSPENYDETDNPNDYQNARLLKYQEHRNYEEDRYYPDIPIRNKLQGGEFKYTVPLNNNLYENNRQRPTQTADNVRISENPYKQSSRMQRLNKKNKSQATHSTYPFPVNTPNDQYDNFPLQRPRQETQVHFYLPEEGSLEKPEQFSNSPVPNRHYSDTKSVDDSQYQSDGYYQSKSEDYEHFPYQLGNQDTGSKYPLENIPRIPNFPKLPGNIHDELFSSISRAHHNFEPPPAFDQDIAKTELHLNTITCADSGPLRGKPTCLKN